MATEKSLHQRKKVVPFPSNYCKRLVPCRKLRGPGDEMSSEPVYDVIVVGSGAAGGIAAYVLATKGLNVLCLEAGRMLDPAKDFYTHKFPFEWPYHGQGKPGRYGKLPQGMAWKIKEWTDHLYTIPEEDPYALAPGSKFTWTRLRAVGAEPIYGGVGATALARSISSPSPCKGVGVKIGP